MSGQNQDVGTLRQVVHHDRGVSKPSELLPTRTSQMKIRVENKVSSTRTTEVVAASLMSGAVVALGFGPVVGILAAVAGICCGYPVAKRQAAEEADRFIPNKVSDRDLQNAMRSGEGRLTVKTDLRNIYPNQPILGRLFIRNRLTKETTYYLED